MALNQEKAGKSTKMSFKTADKIMIKSDKEMQAK